MLSLDWVGRKVYLLGRDSQNLGRQIKVSFPPNQRYEDRLEIQELEQQLQQQEKLEGIFFS